jgi:hypothetical protein
MDKEFRVFYGTDAATKEQLDAIEEIVVEQEVDHAWEARIKIPVCIAEDGSWDGEKKPEFAEFARVRIEARIGGKGDFVPLIDGRIIRQEPDYNASPGLSNITLLVHDDISLLDREAGPDGLENQTDENILTALFNITPISGSEVDDQLPSNPDTNAVNNLSGTRMNMLREMMQRYRGYHAYVLPGDSVGTIKGYFNKFPQPPATDLPVMYLTGPEQNISRFSIQRNENRAARYRGASLSMSDKSVAETDADASPTDEPPSVGVSSAAGEEEDVRVRRIEPGESELTDVQAAAAAAAEESSYTLAADGEVLPQCYSGILRPYMMVSVRVSNSRYSTDYVIRRVTHTLGLSEYTQSFSVVGKAVSPETSPSVSAPAAAAAVAGAAAVSFNIQADIF